MPIIGIWEAAAILAIIVLLFGAKKIPELARSMGQAVKEYRKATGSSEAEEKKESLEESARKLGIDTEGKSEDEIIEEIVRVAKKAKSTPKQD